MKNNYQRLLVVLFIIIEMIAVMLYALKEISIRQFLLLTGTCICGILVQSNFLNKK